MTKRTIDAEFFLLVPEDAHSGKSIKELYESAKERGLVEKRQALEVMVVKTGKGDEEKTLDAVYDEVEALKKEVDMWKSMYRALAKSVNKDQ